MRYDLATLARRTRNPRRPSTPLRPITPPQAKAADLYARCYRPVIDRLTAALPAIVAAYERALPVNDGFRDAASDVQPVLDGLGEALERLVISLAPSLRDWVVRTERWWRERWRGNILTATGVDVETLLLVGGEPEAIGDILAWNVALVRDVGQQAQQRIASTVFAAFQARKPARDLARELREVVGMSRRRAIGIASDQLSKLSSALERERMNEAGIAKFKYRHSGKLHPRSWHRARDGKLYELASGREVGGDDVIAKGDGPGEPPWCGCRRQAVVEF